MRGRMGCDNVDGVVVMSWIKNSRSLGVLVMGLGRTQRIQLCNFVLRGLRQAEDGEVQVQERR
jgi:hypothetical protein